MKLDELINIISNKLGQTINQSMLAESLGITRQTVSNRIKNESELTVSELKKVEEYFNLQILESPYDNSLDVAYIDYYSDVFASCGNGSIVFSSEKTKLPISTSMISGYSKNKLYSMINASGNSMSPTIDNGDKLIVERTHSLDNAKKEEITVFIKSLPQDKSILIVASDEVISIIRGNFDCMELK